MTPIGKLGLKLGSEPLKYGALDLDGYVDESVVVPAVLSRPADSVNYPYGMLGNDLWGDCVIAAMLHAQETFALKRGVKPGPWTTPTALRLYSEITGFDPNAGPSGSNPTDQGTDPSVAFAYWQKSGLPGHQLAGFGVLKPGSPNIRRAVFEFGAVVYALNMASSYVAQGVNWRWTANDELLNEGHAVVGDAYTPNLLDILTWGMEGSMDNAYASNCLEQVLVPLSHDQLNSAGVGPGGFNFARMAADLGTLS